MACFNGGKMRHVFKQVDNLYRDEYDGEDARAALQHGVLYIKVDGA